MPRDDQDALNQAVALLDRVMGRQHPGRPSFYALSRAIRSVQDAAQDLRLAEGRADGVAEAGGQTA